MSVTGPGRLDERFRADFVLFTIRAVTLTLTGHSILLRKTEPMAGRRS